MLAFDQAVDNVPGIPGTTFSDGHGAWRRGVTKNEFELTFLQLHRGVPGDNAVEQVLAIATVTGDTMVGEFRIPTLGLHGSLAGTRIDVTPF